MQPKLNLPPRGQYYSHAATPTLILRSGYCMIRQWTCQQIHSTEWGGGGGGCVFSLRGVHSFSFVVVVVLFKIKN